MEIEIITGRPASGKTSYAHEIVLKNLSRKILYWNLEGEANRYHQVKFPEVYSSSNVVFFVSRLLEDFRSKLTSESFDVVVIDYVELIKSKEDFISEIKNIKTLYVLSQLRKDGTHFEHPSAKIVKLPNRIGS